MVNIVQQSPQNPEMHIDLYTSKMDKVLFNEIEGIITEQRYNAPEECNYRIYP